VSDPRPALKVVLAILPPAIKYSEMFLHQLAPGVVPHKSFDLTLIPNAYEATKDLFPNVTITTDDGNRIRSETRSSLTFPF